jgi:hypothetical protein
MFALLALLISTSAAEVPRPPAKPVAAVKPFDLMYLPRTGSSVLAVRPCELIKNFGEQQDTVTDLARRLLAAGFAFIDGDLRAAPPPVLADSEQLIVSAKATLSIETQQNGLSQFGMLGLSSGLIRTGKPYDWASAIKKWFPKAEVVEHAGREYMRVPITIGKTTVHLALYAADDRTLAFDTDEDEIKGLLARLDKKLKPAAPAGWDEVCRDTVALCHDTTAEGWLTAPESPARAIDRALVTVARKSTGVALGLSAGDRTTVRVVVVTRDEDDALDVRMALKSLVTQLSNEELGPVAKLFAQITVTRTGSVVRARGEVKGNLLRRLLDPTKSE